jgi:glyoxylase-like metal-dependent hydrolase (beta-lactamase superfamily II)
MRIPISSGNRTPLRDHLLRRLAAVCVVLLLITGRALAADSTIFRLQRLSDRVLLLTEKSPMENIVVAMRSQKGLVVVDTFGSPVTAAAARQVIEAEFGRKDFAYVVNTHPHWDHSWGNQVFPEAAVVGFQGAKPDVGQIADGAARMASQYRQQLKGVEQRLKASPQSSNTALGEQAAWMRRLADGLEKDFRPVPPVITFTDRKSLDLGDLTLNVVFFGRAHSGEDIFIHVPEEKLLITGDVFLDRGWMPLFAAQRELDTPRWIEVLDGLLAQDLKTIVPGHRESWTPAKLKLWRNYIADTWEGVKAAKRAGHDLEAAKKRVPLPSSILYLNDLGHKEADINAFHERNIEAFWRQLGSQG